MFPRHFIFLVGPLGKANAPNHGLWDYLSEERVVDERLPWFDK